MALSGWLGAAWRWLVGPRNETYSVSDPALARLFQVGPPNYAGVEVNETSAMSLSAVYRAVALISGTIATLPMRTIRDTADGRRTRLSSFLDDPGGPDGMAAFSWKETVVVHLLLHGNAFLRHIYGGAGQLVALEPVHPLLVAVELPGPDDVVRPKGGKWFRLTLDGGTTLRLDARDMTHVMGLSLDGYTGLSVVAMARNGFGTALAGDRAGAKMFNSGALISGLVTSEDDLDEGEAKTIKATIDDAVNGWENAGTIPFVNRRLKFTPWTMNAQDAQFLESRQFSIREIARWFGIPPHLLMETSAASNWGTGIEQQNLGLARFNLVSWTCRIEQTLSRLLPRPRWVEFDFAGLERPTPEGEIQLLIAQVQARLLTVDEARAIRNLPPLDAGPTPAQQATEPTPTGVPA